MPVDLGIDAGLVLARLRAVEMKLGHIPVNRAFPAVWQVIVNLQLTIGLKQANAVFPGLDSVRYIQVIHWTSSYGHGVMMKKT
jgi:hypothetical protein